MARLNDSQLSSAGYFRFYGLNVHVQSQLDACLQGWMPQANGPVDVRIEQGSTGWHTSGAGDWALAFEALDRLADGSPEFRAERHSHNGAVRFTYDDGVVFTVNQDGTRVAIDLPDGFRPDAMLPALLGPIMGVVMRLRGVVCLHASAVAVGQQVIALVGPSGAGKSTTAAGFAKLGLPVLGDDVLPVRKTDQGWQAIPAYPKLRLWSEAAKGVMGHADALPPMMPGWDKRGLDLQRHGMHFQEVPLPLVAVYFLGPRQDELSPFSDVAPVEALMRLLSDSFASRVQRPQQRAAEFELLGQLVRSLPLRQVSASHNMNQLPALCMAILNDLTQQVLPSVAPSSS